MIDQTICPFLAASECDNSIVRGVCQNLSNLVPPKVDNNNNHYDNGDMLKPFKASVIISLCLENVFEETKTPIDENYAKIAQVELDGYSYDIQEKFATESFMNDSRTTNILMEQA